MEFDKQQDAIKALVADVSKREEVCYPYRQLSMCIIPCTSPSCPPLHVQLLTCTTVSTSNGCA